MKLLILVFFVMGSTLALAGEHKHSKKCHKHHRQVAAVVEEKAERAIASDGEIQADDKREQRRSERFERMQNRHIRQ